MIFIQDVQGRPCMPTARSGRIRRLLQTGQATVVSKCPYVVRLTTPAPTYQQGVILGIDPGMTIGVALITTTGQPLWFGEILTKSAEVSRHLQERRLHRQARHRYRRIRRQRRARRAGTAFDDERAYPLPGTTTEGEPYGALFCHTMKPALARFHNRKRPDKWLTPTATHLRHMHVAIARYLSTLVPIRTVVVEYANFDIHKLWNPEVAGEGYQQGPQYHHLNLAAYVFARDHYQCQLCKKKSTPNTRRVLHAHHLRPQSEGGADRPDNLLTLCQDCHEQLHRSPARVAQLAQKYGSISKRFQATTLVNTIMPFMCQDLADALHVPVRRTYGYLTKGRRKDAGLSKTHAHDAYCIALQGTTASVHPEAETFPVLYGKQFRQHNRQEITRQPERQYREGNGDRTILAKNRQRRTHQADLPPSLAEFRDTHSEACISQLHVTPARHVKKKPKRYDFHAGDIVLFHGTPQIVRGETGNSVYLEHQNKPVPMSKLTRIRQGGGLVWSRTPLT